MKRISIFLLAAVCAMPGALRAQDAATEERLNQLNAKIEVLIEGQKAQLDRINSLEKQLSELQRQAKSGDGASVSADDIKQLEAKLREVDSKRIEDNEHILTQLEKLGTKLSVSAAKPVASSTASGGASSSASGTGYEYVIREGDTLSMIVAAYKEKNIKVTVEQIVAANPGLKPKELKIGQKIFVPAPAQ